MNKSIEQKFDELKPYMAGQPGTEAERMSFYYVKSFFDSQIKQAAEEIRGMGFVDSSEAGQFGLHADGYNQAIEEAAEHLESLI
jgi:hypothetical protein